MSDTGMTTMQVKKINKKKVYDFIYKEGTTSKQQIANSLQMGLSTVTQNLKLLEEDGFIQKNGSYDSTGGRKADAIEIVTTARISIGIALLREMIDLVATDLYGNRIASHTDPLPYEDTESYYQQVAILLNAFVESTQITSEMILGVSIATQGIISNDGTHVTYGSLLSNEHMRLSSFAQYIPYPCRLEHDSKSAATLELWQIPTLQEAVVLILNRNLGGAIISGGKVQEGIRMHSGTIEHLCMNQDGALCYCGKRGCLETYCSADSLQAISGQTIPEFFVSLRTGHEPTILIWQEYLHYLAYAIRNLSVVINGIFIISGFLAPYFTEEDLSYLLERVNRSATFPLERADLILSKNGEYTQAIGASLWYTKEFLHTI
ncbi:MAG: ROK family transcriptional regulator [Eubacteriales bacterium]